MEARLDSNGSSRLMSLDAYRGFIMLAMASGGFGFAKIAHTLQDRGASGTCGTCLPISLIM